MSLFLLEHESPTTYEMSPTWSDSDKLSSPNFDCAANEGAEERLTLGLAPVAGLMEARGLDFDEARLQIVRERMALMGIDEEGLPLDVKLFTFDCQRPAPTVQAKLGKLRDTGFARRTAGCFFCF